MRDWLFSDMSWLFFATWSVIVAAVSYAAFRRDLQPSKALPSSGQIGPRASRADTFTR
jgi:hypothetical protein